MAVGIIMVTVFIGYTAQQKVPETVHRGCVGL